MAGEFPRWRKNPDIRMNRSLIGIPLGDIAGVGPEIVVKALADPALYATARPLVIGTGSALRRALRCTGLDLKLHPVSDPAAGHYRPGSIDLIDLDNIDAEQVIFGQVQAEAGRAAFEFINRAVELAQAGQLDALATTPINKEAFRAAGVPDIGHTELLGRLTGSTDPLTMFQVFELKVFFLSRHVSLAQAIGLVTRERVLDYLRRSAAALQTLGIARPRLAVAGLNPHGGEHGLFGDEEGRELAPAIAAARALGLEVSGPIAADSVFHLALNGTFDAVLSLYHDQGHIATKMVDFQRTIAVTLGLPFIRSSVDHGTAFDLAGTGRANALSMAEAIRLAALYAPLYSKSRTA